MYRIHFDHKTGKFVLQIATFGGLWWSTVKTGEGDGYTFDTFDKAKARVADIGLDKLYENKSADQYRTYISSQRAVI
jgi:hypothetical protein